MDNPKSLLTEADIRRIKHALTLTPLERIQILEKLNTFFNTAMTAKTKQISRQLKQEGF